MADEIKKEEVVETTAKVEEETKSEEKTYTPERPSKNGASFN